MAAVAAVLVAGCRTEPERQVEATGPEGGVPSVAPALEQAIRASMQGTQGLDASRVNVDVVDGVAVLSGLVPSEQDRQRAVEAARQTSGVTEVRDRLIVGQMQGAPPVIAEPSPGAADGQQTPQTPPGNQPGAESAAPSSAEIEARVGQRLSDDARLSGQNIEVSAQDGTVTLRGRVASRELSDRAARVAAGAPGVRRVVNALTVGSGT